MLKNKTLYTGALLAGAIGMLSACGGGNDTLSPSPDLTTNQALVQAGVLSGNPPDASGVIPLGYWPSRQFVEVQNPCRTVNWAAWPLHGTNASNTPPAIAGARRQPIFLRRA